jgi:hypothetical protein
MEIAYELQNTSQESICGLGRCIGLGGFVDGAVPRCTLFPLLVYELALSLGTFGGGSHVWACALGRLGEFTAV